MISKIRKVIVIIFFLLGTFVLQVSCGGGGKKRIFIVKGSESIIHILKQSNSLSKEQNSSYYKLVNTKDKFYFIGGGSTRALAAIIGQTCDLAIVNHTFSFDYQLLLEKYNIKYKMYPFAKSEILFIVNKKNPIASIQLSQLLGVFTGRISNWKLEKEKNKAKKIVKEKKEQFLESEKILIVGRGKSSGNHYWVSQKVLQGMKFSRNSRDYFDDSKIVNFIKQDQGKYAIGYISKNYFISSLPAEKLRKLEKKYKKLGFLDTDEMEKLFIGKNVKRLLVYDDKNVKLGQAFKQFQLHPEIYLLVPQKVNKDLESIIQFFYSDEVRNLLTKNGLTPLLRKSID